MRTILPETYKKYGYKMFDCSLDEWKNYTRECYNRKKSPIFSEKFEYTQFLNISDAVSKIDSIFIPASHGNLPEIKYSLHDSNELLIKEVSFYAFEDQRLYQCAVERAWALGGHLDPRVEQHYYD